MSSYLDDVFGLAGQVAVITGGGTGIGRETAIGMARAGAKIVVVGRRVDKLEDTVSTITENGGTALAVAMDVSDGDSVVSGLNTIIKKMGSVDVLVNNAGTESPKTLLQTEDADWDRVLGVNVVGPWRLAKELVTIWGMQTKGGSIINVGSITGIGPQKGLAAYGVSKAALMHMTEIMALEWAQYGVRVNTIAPGYYKTDMTEEFLESPTGQSFLKKVPMRRAGNLSELVGAMIYLASDASSYVNGTLLTVDGGHSIRSL